MAPLWYCRRSERVYWVQVLCRFGSTAHCGRGPIWDDRLLKFVIDVNLSFRAIESIALKKMLQYLRSRLKLSNRISFDNMIKTRAMKTRKLKLQDLEFKIKISIVLNVWIARRLAAWFVFLLFGCLTACCSWPEDVPRRPLGAMKARVSHHHFCHPRHPMATGEWPKAQMQRIDPGNLRDQPPFRTQPSSPERQGKSRTLGVRYAKQAWS